MSLKNKSNLPHLGMIQSSSFDAIVLGAGIAGLGVAISLARKGKKVLVLYRQALLGEASPAAGGILDPMLELSPGHPMLAVSLKAFQNYPSLIREVEKETGRNIGYLKTGLLYLAKNEGEEKELKFRWQWQRKTGLPVKRVNRQWLFEKVRDLPAHLRSGLFYPTVGRVQPRRWLAALSHYAKKKGVEFLAIKPNDLSLIFSPSLRGGRRPTKQSKSEIASVASRPRNDARIKGISVKNQNFESKIVVLATGSWMVRGLPNFFRLPIKPARGQIAVVKSKRKLTPTILHSLNGSYIVPWGKGEYLIGSTVEFVGFKPRPTQRGLSLILKKAESLLPALKSAKKKEVWAGLRPFSKDKKPLIGPTRIPGLYLAAGYFRSGILIGCYVGELLAQGIINGKWDKSLKPFSPRRFGL